MKTTTLAKMLRTHTSNLRFILFKSKMTRSAPTELPAKSSRFLDWLTLIGFVFFVLSATFVAVHTLWPK